MNYTNMLNAIIDDGIEGARMDYRRPQQKMKLNGSVKGFEECRNLSPSQISELLEEARIDSRESRRKETQNYWFFRCREIEIEWVANVLSYIMIKEGMDPIVNPTHRGGLKAEDILGIQ